MPFSQDRIHELHATTVELRLDHEALLAGVSAAVKAAIPGAPAPAGRLLNALTMLNELWEQGDPGAMRAWLGNAILLSSPFPRKQVYRDARAELERDVGRPGGGAGGGGDGGRGGGAGGAGAVVVDGGGPPWFRDLPLRWDREETRRSQELLQAVYQRAASVRALAQNAGLSVVHIDLEGPVTHVWRNVLTAARNANKLEALLAEVLRDPTAAGIHEAVRALLGSGAPAIGVAGFAHRPSLDTIARLPSAVEVRESDKGEPSPLEKVVNRWNEFIDIPEFRQRLAEAEARVARIDRDGDRAWGTGFLIGPDLLLTNEHVIHGLEPKDLVVRFDHRVSAHGMLELPGRVVRLHATQPVVLTSPHEPDKAVELSAAGPPRARLDFAVLRLAAPVGEQRVGPDPERAEGARRGWYDLPSVARAIDPQEPLWVVGCPRGRSVQLSMSAPSQAALAPTGSRLRYATNTEPGSSGSPVFDQAWQVVALHNSAGAAAVNQGIPTPLIAAALKQAPVAPGPVIEVVNEAVAAPLPQPVVSPLAHLPLILAGPIVRRTEPEGVTVWVAVREHCELSLEVLDIASGEVVATSSSAKLVRLGANLLVTAVTARPFDEGTKLAWGRSYLYDLKLSLHGETRGLRDDGILVKDVASAKPLARLAYHGRDLPGFTLPAEDLAKLRLLHGSCLKPHGPGESAADLIDDVLARAHESGPSVLPPQQLFLTGDQVYCNDVHETLLGAIVDRVAPKLIGDLSAERLPIEGALPGPGKRGGLLSGSAGFTGVADSHLVRLGEFYTMYVLAWSDVLWTEEMRRDLKEFARALPYLRRALANVSTYMTFDDHEVTDDWNLNRKWVDAAHGKALGKRIMRNALAAFAVFQAWGNDPARFADDRPGGALLGLIDRLDVADAAAGTRLEQRLVIRPENASAPDAKKVRWSFEVPGAVHRVVALDTRTRRAFRPNMQHAALLSDSAMDELLAGQSPDDGRLFTVILAATPILGVDLIEDLQRGLTRLVGAMTPDAEAWSLDPATLERLLAHCTRLRRVIALSGDVHYAFGATLRQPGTAGVADPGPIVVSFTASALQNLSLPRAVAGLLGGDPLPLEHALESLESLPEPEVKTLEVKGARFELSIVPGGTAEDLPAPGREGLESLPESVSGEVVRADLVSYNNFGEVRFDLRRGHVVQDIHFRVDGRRQVAPYRTRFPLQEP